MPLVTNKNTHAILWHGDGYGPDVFSPAFHLQNSGTLRSR